MSAGTLSREEIFSRLDVGAFYSEYLRDFKTNGALNVSCHCPFHDDGKASLSVNRGTGLYKCHGCGVEGSPVDFLMARFNVGPGQALSMLVDRVNGRPALASVAKTQTATAPRVESEHYDYPDESGKLLYQVVRFVPKDFRQRRPDGNGGWVWNLADVRRVLYGLPALVAAVQAGETIYVCEGERDADAINGTESGGSFFATCNPMGAGKWRPEYSETLKSANVVVIADRDEPGRKHALDVRASLRSVGVVAALMQVTTGKDPADCIAETGKLDLEPMREPGAIAASAVVPLSSVIATYPEYDAEAAIRRMGLHLWWGAPGNYKTYLALLMALTMTQAEPDARLFGVDAFRIRRRWRRVLWLGDEESAGELRARAEIIARGHGLRPPQGDEIMFADASGGESFLNISDVPALVELVNPDAVIVDPLANLTPSTDSRGNAVKVDLDNTHALVTICRPLRRMCKQRGIAVFLSHHPNASGDRERGPTAYRGSADVVMRVALDGPALVLDFGKNRDARKDKIHLEPVWTGHRDAPDRPLTLALHPTAAPIPPDEAGLPDTAVKMLAAIRAAGPLNQEDVFDAAPGLHRSTYFRNLGLIRQRKLADTTPDGRWISVARSNATDLSQSHEENE